MPTLRQKIISLLIDEEMSAREISGEVGISEKEVYGHLSHIARSVASRDNRKRFTRPGRCPQCKKSHIQSPRFRIY
jgi:predicted Zn-ribbon and HTH transcriptional regulator